MIAFSSKTGSGPLSLPRAHATTASPAQPCPAPFPQRGAAWRSSALVLLESAVRSGTGSDCNQHLLLDRLTCPALTEKSAACVCRVCLHHSGSDATRPTPTPQRAIWTPGLCALTHPKPSLYIIMHRLVCALFNHYCIDIDISSSFGPPRWRLLSGMASLEILSLDIVWRNLEEEESENLRTHLRL